MVFIKVSPKSQKIELVSETPDTDTKAILGGHTLIWYNKKNFGMDGAVFDFSEDISLKFNDTFYISGLILEMGNELSVRDPGLSLDDIFTSLTF